MMNFITKLHMDTLKPRHTLKRTDTLKRMHALKRMHTRWNVLYQKLVFVSWD